MASSYLTNNTLSFSPCPGSLGLPLVMQCATYSVPIDWNQPNSSQIDLGIVKLPAPSSNTTKIGSLFINPGGPGGSAVNLVAGLAEGVWSLPPEVHGAFDIIGLDPRGVRLSGQVQCDANIWAERVNWFPTTQEGYEKLLDKNKRFGESCKEMTGELLGFVDTGSVARDHEAVRIALGDEPLNMIAASYGSFLGATYASLFPNNIRTLVLDGLLQHSQSDSSNFLIEGSAYSISLRRFFTWAATEDSSPLKDHDVEQLWTSLLTNASTHDLPAPSCNNTIGSCRTSVNAEEFLFAAQNQLQNKSSGWPALASALYNATYNNDASFFATQFDSDTLASVASATAIACLDWNHDPNVFTLPYMQAKRRLGELYTPLTAGITGTLFLWHSCINWPLNTTYTPAKMNVETKATILTVNSDADPATGYPFAVGYAEEIRNRVLVTRKGDGHTSYMLGPDSETVKAIAGYLVTGKAPEDGLVLES